MANLHKTPAQRATEAFQAKAEEIPLRGIPTEAYKGRDDLAYALSQIPMLTPRPLKVICMGAGFGGIALAHSVRSGEMPGVDLTIFEKDAGIGGTWWENRYPGCCCDVPSHMYQYTWAPNPSWSSFFAPQPEIQKYFENVAHQHNLWQYIKTSHKIIDAKWIEERQIWQIRVCRTDGRDLVISSPGVSEGETEETWIEECDVFINAGGFFNNWKWPNVKNREAFRGKSLHTAYWPDGSWNHIDGKTVAIIGNGSSGIQVLPQIIDRIEKVYVHIRSPTWITNRMGEKFAGPKGQNTAYTEEEKKRWREDPEEYLRYRKQIEDDVNQRFLMYVDNTPEQDAARKASVEILRQKLEAGGRLDLLELLTPDFSVGCRRPTPGLGYLEALVHPMCELIWGSVVEFTEKGLRNEANRETSVDTIICATGFDLSLAPRLPIIGRNNVNLQEEWLKRPESYLSVCAADMPNYFTILGPASPLGHGSIVTSIELVVRYIGTMVHKLQTENYSSLCVKPGVPKAYQDHAVAFLSRMVWASSCTSTFKNGTKNGELLSLHPGSRLGLYHLLTHPRYEDFDWTSLCSDPNLSFAWMASGFVFDEVTDSGADLSWFLNSSKDGKAVEEFTPLNGHVNGTTNGNINGTVNGVANGIANGTS